MSEQTPDIPSRARSFQAAPGGHAHPLPLPHGNRLLQRLLQAGGCDARPLRHCPAQATARNDLHRFPREAHGAVRIGRRRADGVKLKTDESGACLLLDGDKGCGVYTDRRRCAATTPSACWRCTPRARPRTSSTTRWSSRRTARSRGGPRAHHRRVPCRAGRARVRRYQREWYQLLLKKRSAGPTVGRPPLASLQLFFLACYDVDRFRRFVLSDNFKNTYALMRGVRDAGARRHRLAALRLPAAAPGAVRRAHDRRAGGRPGRSGPRSVRRSGRRASRPRSATGRSSRRRACGRRPPASPRAAAEAVRPAKTARAGSARAARAIGLPSRRSDPSAAR